MPRMALLDKIGREICWLGFTHRDAKRGKTKASYWNSLPKETHIRYRLEAQHLIWLLKTLPAKMVKELTH